MEDNEPARDAGRFNVEDLKNSCSLEYFCEVCGFYPLFAVHGHFECPECHYKTKCCEGGF